jgi:hypothetical protein
MKYEDKFLEHKRNKTINLDSLKEILKNNMNEKLTLNIIHSKYLENKTNEIISKETIRKCIKKVLRYSYKKPSFRSKSINEYNRSTQKLFFVKKFIELYQKNYKFIFIDESTFQQDNNISKLWLKTDDRVSYIKKELQNKENLILAADENNIIYYELNKFNTNTNKFKEFTIRMLESVYLNKKLTESFKEGKIVFILDNAKYHNNKSNKSFWRKHKVNVLFLPVYTPDFNLCEFLFAKLKKKVFPNLRDVK